MQAPKPNGLSVSIGSPSSVPNGPTSPELSKPTGSQPSHVGLGLSSAGGAAISPTRSTFDLPAPNGTRPNDWRRKSTSGGDVRMAVIAGEDDAEDDGDASDPRSKLLGPRDSLPSPGSSSRRKSAFGLAPPSAGGGELISTALTHPFVPVAAYCAASITMTVVNKVRRAASVCELIVAVRRVGASLHHELPPARYPIDRLRRLRDGVEASEGAAALTF